MALLNSTSGNRVGAGFTEGELKLASFWVRNKVAIRNIVWGVLIVVNVGVWGFAIWGLLDAYVFSWPRESRIITEIAQNTFLATQLAVNRPRGIETGGVNVFANTDNRLDMIVEVRNPNEEWWTEFTYRFNVSGELTPPQTGYILPGEETYLGAFGFAPETAGGRSAALTVDNIRWHRVDPRDVGEEYQIWADNRTSFQYDNVEFSRTVVLGTNRIAQTTFDFNNATAYGYWNVGLFVLLKRAESSIAATYITLDQVRPGEVRPVTIDWFETLPDITDTEIVARVQLLDPDAYLPTSFIE